MPSTAATARSSSAKVARPARAAGRGRTSSRSGPAASPRARRRRPAPRPPPPRRPAAGCARGRARSARCSRRRRSCSPPRSAPTPGGGARARPGRLPLKAPSKLNAPTASSRSRATSSPRRDTSPGPKAMSTNGNSRNTCSFWLWAQQPADGHHRVGPLALDALGVAEVAQEALVGAAPDGAGVEEDQVGVVAAGRPPRTPAPRAGPSSARSRGRSSGTRRWSGGSASGRSLASGHPVAGPRQGVQQGVARTGHRARVVVHGDHDPGRRRRLQGPHDEVRVEHLQRRGGQQRHAHPGGDQPLDDLLIGLDRRDDRGEARAGGGALQDAAPRALGSDDPARVTQRGQRDDLRPRGRMTRGQRHDPLLHQQPAHAQPLGPLVLLQPHHGHVEAAVRDGRHGRPGVRGMAHEHLGPLLLGQQGQRPGHQRGQRARQGGHTDPRCLAIAQPAHVRLGGAQAIDDRAGVPGQQATRVGELHAAAATADELHPRRPSHPGQQPRGGGLGERQRARRLGDRPVAFQGIQHAQLIEGDHAVTACQGRRSALDGMHHRGGASPP